MRFGQIQKQLALVSSKVLSSRLKLLETEKVYLARAASHNPCHS
ncbi:winged helix-turn-helix transcriptional regulator [Shewanella sp. cp20]|nr:winged helix-turn-helix transcriptional regulator [Shewanella sp. cp20]